MRKIKAFSILLAVVMLASLFTGCSSGKTTKITTEKFAKACEKLGLDEFDLKPVQESVSLLMKGRVDYEFRTTVVAELHDDSSFEQIGLWIRGAERYFLQRFTDRDTVPFEGLHAPSEEQMKHWAEIVRPYVPAVALRGID